MNTHFTPAPLLTLSPPPPHQLLSQALPPPFNTSGSIFLGKYGTGHLVPETETVPHRRHTHTPAWLVLGRFNDTLFLRHGYSTAVLATQPAPPTVQRLSACLARPRPFSATTCWWWWWWWQLASLPVTSRFSGSVRLRRRGHPILRTIGAKF